MVNDSVMDFIIPLKKRGYYRLPPTNETLLDDSFVRYTEIETFTPTLFKRTDVYSLNLP